MSPIPMPLRALLGIVIISVISFGAWIGVRDTDWWNDFSNEAEPEIPSDLTEVLSTAVVTRANVADEGDLVGELRYQDAVVFAHRIDSGERAVTSLPEPGQIIAPGDVLYETDSTPVYALAGDVAVWRTMDDGMSGDDIAQLQHHLLAGGWGDEDLVDDGLWSATTSAAVERWQDGTGQMVTGQVELGDVWFVPGPIRITSATATEGQVVSDGDELFAYTSDERAIEVTVTELPEGFLEADDLTARLSGGTSVPVELRTVRGAPAGFDIVLDVDLPADAVPVVDGIEITVTWTVNELEESLTVPPEAIRRLDDGHYVVDVLDGDVIRTTAVEVLGRAGRVVAIDGVPELTRVLVP